jgi:hypothetical protein
LVTFFGIDKSKINKGFQVGALSTVGFCAPVATTTTSAFFARSDAILDNLLIKLGLPLNFFPLYPSS